ncbi:unnamed protein product [Ceratitis capitata]|uniref:(Mediterranean fruit fly) hypothetical protein n=1 Tax=Ceratitis capitata TaxID=7213 RepID=A0A811UL97_CERCA|nr:unnamed protein product [Ceratitis capitata]
MKLKTHTKGKRLLKRGSSCPHCGASKTKHFGITYIHTYASAYAYKYMYVCTHIFLLCLLSLYARRHAHALFIWPSSSKLSLACGTSYSVDDRPRSPNYQFG